MAVGKLLVAYYLYRRHKARKLAKQSDKINRSRQVSKPVKNKTRPKPKVSSVSRRKTTTRRKKK